MFLSNKEYWISLGLGGLVFLLLELAEITPSSRSKDPRDRDVINRYTIGYYNRHDWTMNPVRKEEIKKLASDYVNPTNIEFQVRDQDQDGKYEFVMAYKGTNYLMKEVSGRPTLVPFEKKIELIEEK